ncbi:MAG: sulfatase family protein [Planctomycetota bacterium]|jgi:arylsulfatase A-like enzyme
MNNTFNRRDFLKRTVETSAAAVATFNAPSILNGRSSGSPPNVVFIICDQMRFDALSCLGHPNARTPNLDKMAAAGALCENYFANNPVCLPSRITLFSGLYPHQHGSLANKGGKLINTLSGSMLGHFRRRGYRTGWIGKNHTYSKNVLKSLDSCSIRAREPFRTYSKYVPPYWHSDTLWPEEKCHPRMNTNEAINFINAAKKNEPFFLHVSYFDPHPPYMAPSEYTSRYSSKEIVLPPFVHPEKLCARLDEQYRALHYDRIKDSDLSETMRYYYASIEWGVDYQVGRIMETLRKRGLVDNTIVVFTSDHGDFMGEHRMVRKGMFLYDSLLHVPMIWHAPGLVKRGIRINNMTQGVDLFPTLVDLTGGNIPGNLPGRSLKCFLHGETKKEKDFTVFASAAYSDLPPNYFDNPEPAYKPDSDVPFHSRVENLTWKAENKTVMARTARWKLILNETRPPELYDMANGWIEKENLADKQEFKKIRRTLEAKIKKLWKW